MKKLREMKKNNKGFSLVELIVVIAIMVVLIAVLGSTILGYIEKSKYSKDVQALDSLKSAISTYVTEVDSGDVANSSLQDLINQDTSGTIRNVLAEVFTMTGNNASEDPSSGTVTAGTVQGTFNSSSAAFEDITLADIFVTITDGAVSIVVPVNDTENDDYDAYIVGTVYNQGSDEAVKN